MRATLSSLGQIAFFGLIGLFVVGGLFSVFGTLRRIERSRNGVVASPSGKFDWVQIAIVAGVIVAIALIIIFANR
jgi:uncharacterized membrane protein